LTAADLLVALGVRKQQQILLLDMPRRLVLLSTDSSDRGAQTRCGYEAAPVSGGDKTACSSHEQALIGKHPSAVLLEAYDLLGNSLKRSTAWQLPFV